MDHDIADWDDPAFLESLSMAHDRATSQAEERAKRRTKALAIREEHWLSLGSITDEDLPVQIFWNIFGNYWPDGNERQFSSLIGTCPQVLALIWLRYGPDLEEYGVQAVDILITMSWLTSNLPMDVLALIWRSSRTFIHKLIDDTLTKLYEILDEIHWERLSWHADEFLAPADSFFDGVTFALDGTECGIAKPSDPLEEDAWYSYKAGYHTVKYELCTHVSSGRIRWAFGGFPGGSLHDITLTRVGGLLSVIPPGERGVADKGYIGLPPEQFYVPLKPKKYQINGQEVKAYELEERIYNRVVSAIRIDVERVNGRLKRFKVLWRCRQRNRYSHVIVFEVLANIVNIWNEVQPIRRNIHPLLQECEATRPTRSLLEADP